MRAFSFGVLVLSLGCVHAAPRPQPVFVPPPCVNAPEAKKTAVPPPPHESACFRNARPKAIVLEKKDDFVYCAGIDAAELARVEARIQKDLVVHRKPSKLVVDFGCDTLTTGVREVVLEDGSGHGGTLRIVRFERGPSSVDVRMIASSQYYNPGTVISTAQMATADFDAMVAQARVAVLARPHLVPLAQPPGRGFGISSSSSSNDFHLGLGLTDGEGHVVDRHFTGYESSHEQEAFLPMRIATERFEATLASLTFAKQPAATDEDKELFARRFLATFKDGERPFWWITERFVALAAELGTIDIVPALVKIAQKKGDASADRTRPVALAAIAALTGWDPRKDDHGKPRDVDDATAAAVAECAP